MKKVRTEKVNKAIQKSKIENIRKAALEKVKARQEPKKEKLGSDELENMT